MLAVIDGGEQMAADLDLLLTKYFGLTEGYFLRMQELYNLRYPPSNHLEALSGDRLGRVCFEWVGGCAENVELADYH